LTNLLQQLSRAVRTAERRGGRDQTAFPTRPQITLALFLFCGIEIRLPCRSLLAWRRGNNLDLLFFGFFGFPIASLLPFSHVDLPWV
jgi:hypothetical protein